MMRVYSRRTVAKSIPSAGLLSTTTTTISHRRQYCDKGDDGASSSEIDAPPLVPGANHLREVIMQSELQVLWGSTSPYAGHSVANAIKHKERMGFHPCLNTTFPDPKTLTPHDNLAFIGEDILGTNLNSHDVADIKAAHDEWRKYFDKRYVTFLRQQRRTGMSQIGSMHSQLTSDEADDRRTTWQQDSYLQELLAVSHQAGLFKDKKIATMEQFELTVQSCTPEEYKIFCDVIGPRLHQVFIPIPSPAYKYYEGEQRDQWCARYKEAQVKALKFVQTVLSPALQHGVGGATATTDAPGNAAWQSKAGTLLGARMREILEVRKARLRRQEKANVRKPWATMTPQEKFEIASYERELHYKSVAECDVDPEDTTDTSEDWIKEHEQIDELAKKPLEAGDGAFATVNLLDVWTHLVRLEETELEQLHSVHQNRLLAAKALVRVRDEGNFADPVIDVEADLIEAIYEKSSVELKALKIVPNTESATWQKCHWYKFGTSAATQHTSNGARQLQFNFATLDHVAALASAYYQLQPLSSRMHYASPIAMRQQTVKICSDYAIELTTDSQSKIATCFQQLRSAETAAATVKWVVGRAIGKARRAAAQASRNEFQKYLDPIADVQVALSPSVLASASWAPGTMQTVKFNYHPSFCQLSHQVAQPQWEDQQKRAGAVEISLWRKRTAAEMEQLKKSLDERCGAAAAIIKTHPGLKDSIVDFYKELGVMGASDGAKAVEQLLKDPASAATALDEWVFMAMLDDNCHPGVTHDKDAPKSVSLLMPGKDHTGTPIAQAECRVRVRGFQHDVNPSHHGFRTAEAFSAPFQVSASTLPKLAAEYFKAADGKPPQTFLGNHLIPFMQYLRDKGGFHIPTMLEVLAGQVLTPKGECIYAHIRNLIVDSAEITLAPNAGLTDVQMRVEPKVRAHWELHNPGATEDEWAQVRRAELEWAMNVEPEWWREDSMLRPTDDPQTLDATIRYGHDLVQLLSAKGNSLGVDRLLGHSDALVECEYNGDGTLCSLDINGSTVADKGIKLDEVLASVMAATANAQNRLCTLAASKLNLAESGASLTGLLASDANGMLGRHMPTTLYCYRKALEEIDGEAQSIEGDIREKAVDRFASADDPSLRKRLFNSEVGTNKQNLDDLLPDHQSTWK